MHTPIQWPDGKQFAFTIFDDTDLQTTETLYDVYSFLSDLGFRTTKTVWPIKGNESPRIGGNTCEDKQYLDAVLALQKLGYEIALHNVTYHTSVRSETIRGIETFKKLFGHYPYSLANHEGCDESIYWGRYRLTGVHRFLYDCLRLHKNKDKFQGHVEAHPCFWGDVCKKSIKYVRNFVFNDINTLKSCPMMPYHDEDRPFVNYWFASTEGARIDAFNRMLDERHQDQLAMEGGACIMYTHLACGFAESGKINLRFKHLMERLSRMNGWFAPTGTLLDYLLKARGHHVITKDERSKLERTWLMHKIFQARGTS
jgi:hypothetical protein